MQNQTENKKAELSQTQRQTRDADVTVPVSRA